MIEQDMSRDASRDVTQQNKNKKEDIDKEKDNKLIVSLDTICQTDVRRVIEEWNKLQEVGINQYAILNHHQKMSVTQRANP